MTKLRNQTPSAVVVHAGARDSYQVAEALYEVGLLEKLVTNVYSHTRAARKYSATVPSSSVRICFSSFVHYWLHRFRRTGWKVQRASDRSLGELAAKIAHQRRSALIAYSYYAAAAFQYKAGDKIPRILFQLHPHPLSVRRILADELELVPAARDSLLQEMEMSLTAEQLDELAVEPKLADSILVASSFTKRTLAENGALDKPTYVVPYGVDGNRFPPPADGRSVSGPLRVVWLGQICQRKGLSYLLDALRKISFRHLEVKLRGSGRIDVELLKNYSDVTLDVGRNLPGHQILADLHNADIFVLPSLVEGFGHSILEAMSTGLPVITTSHTCGADIVQHRKNGFIVPIRDANAIASNLEWAITHRSDLRQMGHAAQLATKPLSWQSFRDGVRNAYRDSFVDRTKECQNTRSTATDV